MGLAGGDDITDVPGLLELIIGNKKRIGGSG